MTADPETMETIRVGLAGHGFSMRGHVNFDKDGPEIPTGGKAGSLVLVGNIGGSLWPAFIAWQRLEYFATKRLRLASAKMRQNKELGRVSDSIRMQSALKSREGEEHPLDHFSKSVIGPLATRIGGHAFYPSDQPWQPFQRWAMRAEGLKPSPLGILIHPQYGLWHGYRGAIAFADRLELPEIMPLPCPCDTCIDKQCLHSCPVGAVTSNGFRPEPCRGHLATAEGENSCMHDGCVARNACPVGTQYLYGEEQLRFHMRALVA